MIPKSNKNDAKMIPTSHPFPTSSHPASNQSTSQQSLQKRGRQQRAKPRRFAAPPRVCRGVIRFYLGSFQDLKVFRWVTHCRRPLPKVHAGNHLFQVQNQDPKNMPKLLKLAPKWSAHRTPNPYKCYLGALQKQSLTKMLKWDIPKVGA